MVSALVLGGADCLARDMEQALKFFTPDLIIACNHAGRDQPRVDHWCTLHQELFPKWIAERKAKGLPDAGQLWTSDTRKYISGLVCKRIQTWGGSSGLFSVAVGTHLGITPMVLCGIPLLPEHAHYDDKKRWHEATQYRPGWLRHKHEMLGKVKSMSGWTRKILGEPTKEWINGGQSHEEEREPGSSSRQGHGEAPANG